MYIKHQLQKDTATVTANNVLNRTTANAQHQLLNDKFFAYGNRVLDSPNDPFDLSLGNILNSNTNNSNANNLERIRPRTDVVPYKRSQHQPNRNDLPLMSELLLANTEQNKNSI